VIEAKQSAAVVQTVMLVEDEVVARIMLAEYLRDGATPTVRLSPLA
jgi:hypothetical protein